MVQSNAIAALLKKLKYSFNDLSLLDEALTHRSYASKNNERLEFLGDGILNFVIAHELFKLYPDVQEGDLSRLRANLVNKDSLADIARHLQLGDVIKLGSGELKSGGFRRPSILADAVESILGAVYCDGGFEQCRALIIRLYADRLASSTDLQSLKDSKTQLQELLQSRHFPLPGYQVTNITGQAHAQVFHVKCNIDEMKIEVTGEGKSRRKAEQIAAKKAIIEVMQRFEDKSK
ncbi:MAG: ribonuclease III [Gammaproteobacteria bacterium]|nr:ribonuclease III [Gammaproteobacteria bacterium]MBT8133777.1 ribonuclease III [Gammaproteobacteria bacterium]NNJ50151.1 ribonuclease III [Gammaproteobacteria bacterium]